MRRMRSEVATDGETGIDDIATCAADAPRVSAVAAQRVDAARVRAATRDSPEHADLVAASLPAGWRTGNDSVSGAPGERYGGVHRGATLSDRIDDARRCGGRAAERACPAGARWNRQQNLAARASGV